MRAFACVLLASTPLSRSLSLLATAPNHGGRLAPVCCTALQPQAPSPPAAAAPGAPQTVVGKVHQVSGGRRRRSPVDTATHMRQAQKSQHTTSASANTSRQVSAARGGQRSGAKRARRGSHGRGAATAASAAAAPAGSGIAAASSARLAGGAASVGGTRGSSKARNSSGGGSGRGLRQEAKRALTDYVRDLEPRRLLEHSEEIALACALAPLGWLTTTLYFAGASSPTMLHSP